jgi:hypothetical protein
MLSGQTVKQRYVDRDDSSNRNTLSTFLVLQKRSYDIVMLMYEILYLNNFETMAKITDQVDVSVML